MAFFHINSTNLPLVWREKIVQAVLIVVMDYYDDVIYRHASASAFRPCLSFCSQFNNLGCLEHSLLGLV